MHDDSKADFGSIPFFEDNRNFKDITHHCAEVINNYSGVEYYYTNDNGMVVLVTDWNDVPRFYRLADGTIIRVGDESSYVSNPG
jgi:hypothetical protein